MDKMDKIREKLARLNGEKTNKSERKTLQLEYGDLQLRIVPPLEDGDPFLQVHFHYLGRIPVPCLNKNWNEKCPICETATKYWQSGKPESQELAKELFSKERFYSPVVVRGQEKDGCKIFAYGVTNYREFLESFIDPEIGDFTDVSNGRDVKVTKTPANKAKKERYDKVKVKVSTKVTPLSTNKKEIQEILDSRIDILKEVAVKRTPAEMLELLDAFLKPSTTEMDSGGDKDLDDLEKAIKGDDDIPF